MPELSPAEALLQLQQGKDLDRESMHPGLAMRDGSADLYSQVRERIVRPGGLFIFAKGLCGFPDLTKRTHLALCMVYELLLDALLVEFPKSHLKTSIGTIARTLRIHALRAIKGEDLSDRAAIASNTKTNAMRMLRLLMNIVESNILFQNFIPELMPEFANENVWNKEEIVFPRVGSYTDPSVDTLGVGGASTSRHFTHITEDDMLDEEDHDSPSAVKKAVALHRYYTSLLVPTTDGRPGSYLVNEHAWTDYDLNNHIIDKEPDTAVFSVGASNGYNHKRSRHIPDKIVALTRQWEDRRGVWPERYDKHELLRRRQKAGARVFNAVFENAPYDPDVVDFKEEWLRYYEWTGDGKVRLLPCRGQEMEIIPLTSLNVVAAYDPALSEKTDADRSAHVVTGVDPLDRIIILEAYARRMDPMKYVDKVLEQVIKWNVQQDAVESVLFQKVLYDILVSRCRAWNAKHASEPDKLVFPGIFREVKPPRGKNKTARIRALIGTAFEEGRVYIHASMTDFIDEYLKFPISQTVDLLDAFAYTSELWSPGITEEDMTQFLAEEQRWANQRDGVTGY